ncbi:MAG: magnesium/cobalt transporter CorA [Geodermatophilaceae bacterium]
MSRTPETSRRLAVGPVGEPPKRDHVVGCGVYVDGQRIPHEGDYTEAARLARERGGYVWLGLHEPTAEEVGGIAAEFGLHPLAVEDAVKAHQRPKLERYDDMLFFVLKTCRYVEHEQLTATSDVIATGEVMIFSGADYVVTVRHGEHTPLHGLRERLTENPELLRHGPAAILYAITDLVVDEYVDVAAQVEVDIEELEESVFSPRRTDDIGRIYQLKRELLELRRAVSPLAVPLNTLTERNLKLVPESMREYFRDVDDHVSRVSDQITGFDELLSSILQASLARVALAENEDIRKISAWVAIAAVPTAVAGIYGMNFDYMPELRWMFGYPLILAVILTACIALYRGFKRSGWL